MADIRINALATTATTPASDDYLALDGTAQGTRKILATDIANNVTDVILGASGPSVKSTLSARAPRQGLVFDGTNGATATLASAIGTSAASFSFIYTVPTSNPASAAGIFGVGSSAAFTVAGSFSVVLATNGDLEFYLFGTPNTTSMNAVVSGFRAAYSGKSVQVTATRDGSTFALLINGVSTSFTLVTSTGSWADTISGTSVMIGDFSNIAATTGVISQPLIYNRALSAAEVVALYEAGAPSGEDYPKTAGAGTTLNTANFVDLVGGSTLSGNSPTGVTVVRASGTSYIGVKNGGANAKPRDRFRLSGTLTLNNGKTSIPVAYVDGSGATQVSLSAGAFSIEIVAPASGGTSNGIVIACTGDQDWTLSGFSAIPLGLLLAPDAAQAGNGYVWNDQSGNLAQIVLPSSGVQWNLPSIAGNRIRGTTSTNGNQQLLGASVLLPAECQITHVRARAQTGTPTITIGTASGGAQIVASVALSTTWLNCTIALTGGIVSSADDIWVGSNSTDVVETDIALQPLDF